MQRPTLEPNLVIDGEIRILLQPTVFSKPISVTTDTPDLTQGDLYLSARHRARDHGQERNSGSPHSAAPVAPLAGAAIPAKTAIVLRVFSSYFV